MSQRSGLNSIRSMAPCVLFVMVALFVSFSTNHVIGTEPSSSIPSWIKEFVTRHSIQLGKSKQLIFATNRDAMSFVVTVHVLEERSGQWILMFPTSGATIGEKGFAPVDKKEEGDGKSPTGIFPLGTAFGYDPSVATKMPYRQATDDDFWVDDVHSEDYNKWVRGQPKAASVEKMKREDDLYKFGIVIEYNTNPIVKGKGSAIFLHLWRGEGKPTLGCVAMPENQVLKLLGWLDPSKKPLIVMGTEAELQTVRPQAAQRLSVKWDDVIDLKEVNPRIVVDMKYATEDNFAKKTLYDSNTCFLRRSTAIKLDSVQRELEGMNLGLKVWDCYRPLAVQRTLWTLLPDQQHMANPERGSRHNRAAAVDVTLVDSRGNELQMPTAFDDFSSRAHRRYRDLPDGVIRNRKLLESLMKKAGFIPLPQEWWHYDDENWMRFSVMDVPFQGLSGHQTP